MISHRVLFKAFVSKVANFSIILEQRINNIKQPRWRYPKINSNLEDKNVNQLLKLINETDSIFLESPSVSFIRKAMYLSLRIPYRLLRKMTRLSYGYLLHINHKLVQTGKR